MKFLRPRSKEAEIYRSQSQASAVAVTKTGTPRTVREIERRIRTLEAAYANIAAQGPVFIAGPLYLWGEELPEGTVVPEGGRIVEDIYGHFEPAGFMGHFVRERITFDPEDYGKECEIDESEDSPAIESKDSPANEDSDEEPRA